MAWRFLEAVLELPAPPPPPATGEGAEGKTRTATWHVDKHVLTLLAHHANKEPPHRCDPSVGRLAKESGLDPRTVQRAIQRLLIAGLLSREERSGRAPSYRVLPNDAELWNTRHGAGGDSETATPGTEPPHPRHGATRTVKNQRNIDPPPAAAVEFELPGWVPEPAWMAFEAMRAEHGKPLAASQKRALVRKLEGLVAEGHTAEDAIELATRHGWSDFHAPRADRAPQPRRQPGEARTAPRRDPVMAHLAERAARGRSSHPALKGKIP